MRRVRQRLALIVPLTLFLIVVLLFLNTKSMTKTLIVLLAVPFSAIGAIVERLLPRTDTPGALDAGVPAFVDTMFGEFLSAEEKDRLERLRNELRQGKTD